MSENMKYEELLVLFEQLDRDVKVESILKEVKKDLEFLKDRSLDEFGEKLFRRDQEKLAAQLEREELVRVLWSSGHYPQLTCDWFVEGLDFCWDYWRYEFKRPMTPPPLPRK